MKIYIPKYNLFNWKGGKKWLKNELENILKKNINKINKTEYYIEPFLGGLGSFKIFLPYIKNKKILVNDINFSLINFYQILKNYPNELIENFKNIELNFQKTYINKKVYAYKNINRNKVYGKFYITELHKTKDKEELKILLKNTEQYFNTIRNKFNELKQKEKLLLKEKIDLATYFLFLMLHSFNGNYRENSKGLFNNPFNWEPKVLNIDNKIQQLKEYNKLFNQINIQFFNLDVFEFLKIVKPSKSFIYIDPPYINEKNTKSTHKYNKINFDINKQYQLINELNNFYFYIYSNHYNENLIMYIKNNLENYYYNEVFRKNLITSKIEDRKLLKKEILIYK